MNKSICLLAILAAVAGLAGQARPPVPQAPTPKRSPAAQALADRIAEHAGGTAAFAKLKNLTLRVTKTTRRGTLTRATTSAWLLIPGVQRARWENLEPVAAVPKGRTWAGTRELMVLGPDSRRNLLTLPERPGPRVSLWGSWHPLHRLVFLPFVLRAPQVELEVRPRQKADKVGRRRLLVTWPKSRNYKWVDAFELITESDTGRILELIEISGSRGQKRAHYTIARWTKLGALKLPMAFELTEGRGSSLSCDRLRRDVVLPKDAWSRRTKIIAGLRPKPQKAPTSRKSADKIR